MSEKERESMLAQAGVEAAARDKRFAEDPSPDAEMKRQLVGLKDRVRHNSESHAVPEDRAAMIERVRELCRDLNLYLVDAVPPSREQSMAITRVEEAAFWAIAGICRNQ